MSSSSDVDGGTDAWTIYSSSTCHVCCLLINLVKVNCGSLVPGFLTSWLLPTQASRIHGARQRAGESGREKHRATDFREYVSPFHLPKAHRRMLGLTTSNLPAFIVPRSATSLDLRPSARGFGSGLACRHPCEQRYRRLSALPAPTRTRALLPTNTLLHPAGR